MKTSNPVRGAGDNPSVFGDNDEPNIMYPEDFDSDDDEYDDFLREYDSEDGIENDSDDESEDEIEEAYLPEPVQECSYVDDKVATLMIHRNDKTHPCSVPGCTSSVCPPGASMFISKFQPPKEDIEPWSLLLGVKLTLKSYVCEDHFRPEDFMIVDIKLKSGISHELKTLKNKAMPVRLNY